MQVTHKESKSVMAYQLPTEIQHMIWTYSMYNSAKGLGFRKQIQEGWFKLRLRRWSNALETKSQDIYHQELGQLLLSMDELLNRERRGSVVECLTRDRRAAGSSLTGVTALLSLSKTHLS